MARFRQARGLGDEPLATSATSSNIDAMLDEVSTASAKEVGVEEPPQADPAALRSLLDDTVEAPQDEPKEEVSKSEASFDDLLDQISGD